MSDKIVQQPVATSVQARFSELPTADVDRSTFDMSHAWKGTMDAPFIVPCLLQEILPGDTFSVNSTAFMRLATPIKPIMDNLTADIHYFFVPNRLVWDNWQFFMGERTNVDDDPTTVSIPQMVLDMDVNLYIGTMWDYFGLPLVDVVDAELSVNALPFRGYGLIYNEWYRNQNLEDSMQIPTDDGPDEPSIFTGLGIVRRRMKRGDYFTKALPWPQKGDAVFLPLGETAPVVGNGTDFKLKIQGVNNRIGTGPGGDAYGLKTETTPATGAFIGAKTINGLENFTADLSTATAATINDIRTAFQIQKLLERDARGGTRYIEILLSHFNVQSPDFRLQRPEYLGGGSGRITVNPVASTVETVDAPQANLAAVGTGICKASFNHSFTEHGFVFGLISTRADSTYQYGVERFWNRTTRYEYYWPALAHLGEQAITNEELYWRPGTPVTNKDTWGYQERYAEYRYQPSRITGLFRSEAPASLDVWHLSQDFNTLPALDINFISEDPPVDRVIAVPSEPHLLVDVWHSIKATRPMPIYSVPGLVDHF